MPDSIITPAMRQAEGVRGAAVTARIERGAIVRFAEAIGDPNPRYYGDKPAAPPTFLRSVGLSIPPLPDAEALPRVLDGGSEWTYETPVHAGDSITFSTTLESLGEREGRLGPMLIATYLTEYTNQAGALAATQRNTVIRMRESS